MRTDGAQTPSDNTEQLKSEQNAEIRKLATKTNKKKECIFVKMRLSNKSNVLQ